MLPLYHNGINYSIHKHAPGPSAKGSLKPARSPARPDRADIFFKRLDIFLKGVYVWYLRIFTGGRPIRPARRNPIKPKKTIDG
jgi:hypothetical protein